MRSLHIVECMVRGPYLGYVACGTGTRLEWRMESGPDSRVRGGTGVVVSDVPVMSKRLPWMVCMAPHASRCQSRRFNDRVFALCMRALERVMWSRMSEM